MWFKLKVLGKGSYGLVYLALPSHPSLPNQLLAVKASPLTLAPSLQKEERVCLEFMDCPEIVRCIGSGVSLEHPGLPFYNLVLEYAPGGSLADLINNNRGGRGMQESDIKRCTRMILKGLCSLHDKGFVHCDLKPANILVFPSQERGGFRLKLADFGLTKLPGEQGRRRPFQFHGTPTYMSPESYALGEIEAPLDIWSLGCIVMEMTTGRPPWADIGIEALAEYLGWEVGPPDMPNDVSPCGKDFLTKCFDMDPRQRWTAAMLLNHPFLTQDLVPNNLDTAVNNLTNALTSFPAATAFCI